MAANELSTARLRLVPARAVDTDTLHAVLCDPAVRRYLCDDRIVPRKFAENLVQNSLESFETRAMGLWLLYETASTDQAAIGFCMLRPEGDRPSPELLYALVPAAQRRGLAIEAARAVLAQAFEKLGCPEVFAEMDEPNSASLRVAQTLGMTSAGSRPGPAHMLLRYTLRREDFVARDC